MLLDTLKRANEIQRQIDSLQQEQDELLSHVCSGADAMSDEDLRALINELPRGFYRTELRAILIGRTSCKST